VIHRRYVPVVVILLLAHIAGCSQKIDTYEEFCELALRHERDGELSQAVVAYEQALELQPSAAVTWYDLGVAHVQLDHLDDAQAAYTKAIELDPTLAMAYNNRATVWAEQQQFERAIEDFSQAIKLDPRDALACRNRGLAHYDLGRFEAARQDYDASIRISGSDPTTYLYRGNTLLDLRLWERALEDFDNALELDESLPDAWLNRAQALVELNRIDAAQETVERAGSLGADVSRFSLEPRGAPSGSTAVDAVRVWLQERDLTADKVEFPWDLTATQDGAEVRYLVREVVSPDSVPPSVRVLREELDVLRAATDARTALVLVEHRAIEDSPAVWQVVRVIDDWQPDLTLLRPESWSLPLDATATQP